MDYRALSPGVEDPAAATQVGQRFLESVLGCPRGADIATHLRSACGDVGPCAKVWGPGTIAYRCKTCQVMSQSALCVECFRAGNHEGHDFSMYRSEGGGCCDCGDLTSWARAGCCPTHKPTVSPRAPLDQRTRDDIVTCLDWVLHVILGVIVDGGRAGVLAAMGPRVAQALDWITGLSGVTIAREILCEVLARQGQGAAPRAEDWSSDPPQGGSGTDAPARGIGEDRSQPQTAFARDTAAKRSVLAHVWSAGVPAFLSAEGQGDYIHVSCKLVHAPPWAAIPDDGGGGAEQHASRVRPLLPMRFTLSSLVTSMHIRSLIAFSLAPWQCIRARAILIRCLPHIPPEVAESATALLLTLLYDVDFKRDFTRALLPLYGGLILADFAPAVHGFLERITVQLFNVPEVTLYLAEKEGAIDAVVDTCRAGLERVLTRTAPLVGPWWPVLDLKHSEVTSRRPAYHRALNDLHMLLSFYPVIERVLAQPGSRSLELLAQCVGRMQFLAPMSRKLGNHVEIEDPSWSLALTVEAMLLHPILNTTQGTLFETPDTAHRVLAGVAPMPAMQRRPSSRESQEREVAVTPSPVPYCWMGMAFAHEALRWSMLLPQRMGPLGRSTGEGPPFASIFSDLMSGAAYVSPQLPLHRCAAACIGLGIAAAWLPDVEGMSPTTRKGSGGAGRAERDLTRDGGEGERGMSRGEEEEEAGSRGGEEEEGSRGGEEEAGPAFVEHCVKEKGPLWSALAFDVLRQAVWLSQAQQRFWVRNGTAPRSIAHHARSSIRTDLCTAPDTLCLQLWLASCQDADGDRPLHLTPIICVILLTVHLIEAIAVPAACPGSHLAWAAVLHERRERETLVVSAEALVSFLSAFGGPEMKHTLAMAVASQPGRAEGEGREEGARANAVKMGTWEVRWLSGGENAGATTGGTASGAVSEAVRAAEAVGWAMAGVEETIGTLSALKTWDDGRRMQCFVDGVRTVVACMKDRGMWGMSLGERSRYEVLQSLATAPMSHSTLVEDHLGLLVGSVGELDEILNEMAHFQEASLERSGLFLLRGHLMEMLDPFFTHRTVKAQEETHERARVSPVFKGHHQLARPWPLPRAIAGLSRVAHSPLVPVLLTACVREAMSSGLTSLERLLPALFALYSVAIHDVATRGSLGCPMTPPPRHWPYNPDGPRDDALDVRSWRLGGAEWARAASTVAVAAAWGGAVRVAGEGAAAEMVAVRKDLGLGEALRSFVEWCEEGGEDESVWEVKECAQWTLQAMAAIRDAQAHQTRALIETSTSDTAPLASLSSAGRPPAAPLSVPPRPPARSCGDEAPGRDGETTPGQGSASETAMRPTAAEVRRRKAAEVREKLMRRMARKQEKAMGAWGGAATGRDVEGRPQDSAEGDAGAGDQDLASWLRLLTDWDKIPSECVICNSPDPPSAAGPSPGSRGPMCLLTHVHPADTLHTALCPLGAVPSRGGNGRAVHHDWTGGTGAAAAGTAEGVEEGGEVPRWPGESGAGGAVERAGWTEAGRGEVQWGGVATGTQASVADQFPGVMVRSCGHAAHAECLSKYRGTLLRACVAGLQFDGQEVANPREGEVLCPLCRRLCNAGLPAAIADAPGLAGFVPTGAERGEEGAEEGVRAVVTVARRCLGAEAVGDGVRSGPGLEDGGIGEMMREAMEERDEGGEGEEGREGGEESALGGWGKVVVEAVHELKRAAMAAWKIRDDASARRAFSVDGTALEAPLPQRDEATHPRPSALSLLLASLGLDPGPDLPAGQAWFDGPRARAVVCAALVCGVSHFEALGRPRATAPASGAGGSHGGADAAGGQAGGGALSSPGSGQWRALRAMCCLWAALRCGVWGCDGGNARPAASRTAGGDLPGGGAGSCGRDPLWRWVCGGGGPEAGSKSLIAWRSLVCDPWLLVAALLDRRWGLTTGKDAEHPLAVAWESARVCLAVAAHQAVVHAVAGWAGGVGWGRAGSAMRAEDLTRAYRDACMLLGGQEGSEDRDESETRLHLRYSMALQLLPLVRRIRVLFAALCLAPQPEDLPGAFPDPSARPEDVPCSARLAVSEALERALFEMGMPSAVRLATVAARLPNAPRGDMLLLRWVAGDERAAALTLGEKRRHRAVKRFAVAEMRGAAEGSREDAQMDSGGEGQSAGHVRGRNWAVAVPPIPRAPQLLLMPTSYQDLFLATVDARCQACGERRSELALCLVCGARMCVAEAACRDAQYGGRCYAHSQQCGAGTGLFFLLDNTRLLSIRGTRICFMPSLYLDAHGEEDPGMRRGKLLRLSPQRFSQASQLWAAAAFDYETRLLQISHGRTTEFEGAGVF